MMKKQFKRIQLVESKFIRTLESSINDLISEGYQPLDLTPLANKKEGEMVCVVMVLPYAGEEI